MAPFVKNPVFRLHPMLSRAYVHLLNARSKIHKLPNILLHKLHPVVFNHLKIRDLPPFTFYHPDDMGPGPSNAESLSSKTNDNNVGAGAAGALPRHRFYPTPLNHLSIWAHLALAFVILTVVTVISYMIYTCYHSARLVESKPKVSVAANAGGVKGGWQTLEDPIEEMRVEGSEDGLKDREAGEKIDDYQDETRNKKNGMIDPWSERRGSGLKGLGIQLHRSSKSQYDFTSHANESQASIISGGPHSTCSDRSLGSTSDREHEDVQSSEGSDCPSMSAQPLAHTTDRSAAYLPFHVPPPLPLPLPLPPVTPSPQPIKQKKTRLRALTQILAHKLTQNQNGREMYFELQPMITAGNEGGQSKGLSETLDESSPPSPSPSPQSKFSPAQFAYFAPYPNCNSTSNSRCNLKSNSWGNNSSCSPTTFPTTPITPLTPITPVTPVTPIKPGSTAAIVAELQFDSNNIQFIETPVRTPNDSPGAFSVSASPPEIQRGVATVSINSLTRAEILWNDPKLSPVQGAFGVVGGEKTSPVTIGISPTEIGLAKTRAVAESQLKSPTTSVWQGQGTFGSRHRSIISVPTLATPDQVHRGHANLRLGYLRRGVSLSSPPSPSPSSRSSYSSSDSVTSSPSIATARFILDRGELTRDNLRNRDKAGLIKEKGREKQHMKPLSPIPRPVFLPQLQPPRFQAEESF